MGILERAGIPIEPPMTAATAQARGKWLASHFVDELLSFFAVFVDFTMCAGADRL
jgi:hypothetical protein